MGGPPTPPSPRGTRRSKPTSTRTGVGCGNWTTQSWAGRPERRALPNRGVSGAHVGATRRSTSKVPRVHRGWHPTARGPSIARSAAPPRRLPAIITDSAPAAARSSVVRGRVLAGKRHGVVRRGGRQRTAHQVVGVVERDQRPLRLAGGGGPGPPGGGGGGYCGARHPVSPPR